MSAEGKARVAATMRNYQPPSWSMHPTDHYQHFLDYVHAMLQERLCGRPGRSQSDLHPARHVGLEGQKDGAQAQGTSQVALLATRMS